MNVKTLFELSQLKGILKDNKELYALCSTTKSILILCNYYQLNNLMIYIKYKLVFDYEEYNDCYVDYYDRYNLWRTINLK